MSIRDIRNTRQMSAIREAFAEADRPLSPEEALRSAQQHHPGVGIATVYRNIQTLVEEGWLQPVEVPGDATRYEVAGKLGFRASGHEFYVYGTCAACIPGKA